MSKLILTRHGQSIWNAENRFTGWVDVDLSKKGVEEAEKSGELIKKLNIKIDISYTSFLKRAIKTLTTILKINNLELHVWTVNSIENFKTCLEIGCDGVITDEPILFRNYLNK